MADDRVITLRFKPESVPDMELYRELEMEKEQLGLSMPVYVKSILWRHFGGAGQMQKGTGLDASCMEQMKEIVHEELASQSDILVGMLERITEGLVLTDGMRKTGPPEEVLPRYSDAFPEGLNGVLEKFM